MAFGCLLSLWSMMTILAIMLMLGPLVQGEEQVPCFFILGDSIVDNGNNNNLITEAKANYPPYGIDFPGGPTGRFTNGRNLADILAELLGFTSSIPPFATARGTQILKGVNYGSGAAGIRDETARHMGDRISLNRQLLNHKLTVSRIAILLGSRIAAKSYLSKCLYIVNMGSNDYLNNYLMPQYYPTNRLYTPDQYAALLVRQYYRQLRTLYNSGARKVAVYGLGLIGCVPSVLKMQSTNGSPCVDSVNFAAQLFNDRLKPIIDNLNSKLPDAKFIYINQTSISSGDPSAAGLKVVNAPCCKVSPIFAEGQCIPGQIPCNNRTEYVFYDNFHTTEIVNMGTAIRSYTALLPTDAYPFDIRSLVNVSQVIGKYSYNIM